MVAGIGISSVISYVAVGALSQILPDLIGGFLPVSGILLAGVLLAGAFMLKGKMPYVPMALGVAGGALAFGSLTRGGFSAGAVSETGAVMNMGE